MVDYKIIKKILAGIITLSSVVLISGCGCQQEFLENNNTEQSVTDITIIELSESVSENITSSESIISEQYDKTGGGNPYSYSEIEITVSDSQYFYDNHEISFDEFVDLVKEADMTVKLSDEFASDDAFSKITDYLDKEKIPYTME